MASEPCLRRHGGMHGLPSTRRIPAHWACRAQEPTTPRLGRGVSSLVTLCRGQYLRCNATSFGASCAQPGLELRRLPDMAVGGLSHRQLPDAESFACLLPATASELLDKAAHFRPFSRASGACGPCDSPDVTRCTAMSFRPGRCHCWLTWAVSRGRSSICLDDSRGHRPCPCRPLLVGPSGHLAGGRSPKAQGF